MSLSISKKVYALVTLTLVLELFFVGILFYLQKQLQTSYSKEIDARKLSSAVNGVMADGIKAGAYGVLSYTAQDKLMAKELRVRLKKIASSHAKLLEMKGISDQDRKTLKDMIAASENLRKQFNEDNVIRAMENKASVLALHVGFEELISQGDRLLARLNSVQESQRLEQEQLRALFSNIVLYGLVLNVVAALFFAAYLNRDIVSRLRVLLSNFQRLADGEQLLPARVHGDEIGRLDKSFHEMAGVLQSTINREQAILQNTVDIILSIDSFLEVKFVNKACFKKLGYMPEEIIGNEVDFIVCEDDVDSVRRVLLQAQEDHKPCTLELKLKHKNGSQLFYVLSSYFAEEEALTFCVMHDVSEAKKLERNKRDFIAMASHDMRSPLTGLNLTLGLLEDGSLKQEESETQELIRNSRKDINRIVGLVNDLLDAEKLDQEEIEITKTSVELDHLFNAALSSVGALAEQKNISVTALDSSGDARPGLDCDEDRIIQVLVNLLGNAIKFSPPNSKIEIGAKFEKSLVEIFVKDNGPGIPEMEQDNIFEQFHQGDSSEKKGSGLGLYICKQLVEAHSGSIGVESKVGEGSRFWFQLPVS